MRTLYFQNGKSLGTWKVFRIRFFTLTNGKVFYLISIKILERKCRIKIRQKVPAKVQKREIKKEWDWKLTENKLFCESKEKCFNCLQKNFWWKIMHNGLWDLKSTLVFRISLKTQMFVKLKKREFQWFLWNFS